MESESNKMKLEINSSKKHKIITVLFISLKQNNMTQTSMNVKNFPPELTLGY